MRPSFNTPPTPLPPVLDGYRVNVAALVAMWRMYWLPALRWYAFDVRKHYLLFTALVCGRLVVATYLYRVLNAEFAQYGDTLMTALPHLRLGHIPKLFMLAPWSWTALAVLLKTRFKRVTYMLYVIEKETRQQRRAGRRRQQR